MIKILFFLPGLKGGGKERRITELLKNISRNKNFEIELIVMDKEIHYKEVFDLGIQIHYLVRKSKKDSSIFFRFYKICKEFHPEIIHSWHSMTTFYTLPSKLILGFKLINSQIADVPNYINPLSVGNIVNKINFYFSDIIISNSIAGLEAYKPPNSKSIYIHNGFDFKRLEVINSQKQVRKKFGIVTPYVIGMVARYSDKKDYRTYIEAAKKILDIRNDVTFIAAGGDLGTKNEMATLLETDKHQQFIKLLDRQSQIESLINIFTIGVLCTHSEGISNSILEYMALEKPVIASEGGGTNELVVNNETGFLIPHKNPDILFEKIDFLLENPDCAVAMGKCGKTRIKKFFNIDKMVEAYISNYGKIYQPSLK
ncbi:hypothetical protein AYK24_03295 [Thermoplasmatales archaeon SG8-52-4]|nr:MAG: hypothetical protein AYK24_03295 [Thermoplasmatales archaeon SG8-52-4]